jgi:hypothetical protein
MRMGLWSKIKKAIKRVVRIVKAVARVASRLVVEWVSRLFNLYDLLLGFLTWPPKKLRLYVCVLRDADGTPVVDPKLLQASIDHAKHFLKSNFNIVMKPYSKSYVEVLPDPAPIDALRVNCGLKGFEHEFGKAGEYFAKHLAGWNAIPVSLTFPITVFIIEKGLDHPGCSLCILSDYVVVDRDAIVLDNDFGLMMHEMGHCCGQPWHSGKSNFMYPTSDRGDGVNRYQKNLVRSSRHITYW